MYKRRRPREWRNNQTIFYHQSFSPKETLSCNPNACRQRRSAALEYFWPQTFAVRRCCSHTAWACSACMVYELWKGQEQCINGVPKLRRNIRTESHQQHTAIIHSATGSSGHHTLKALYKRRKRESSTTFCLYISHSPVCTLAHTHTHIPFLRGVCI